MVSLKVMETSALLSWDFLTLVSEINGGHL